MIKIRITERFFGIGMSAFQRYDRYVIDVVITMLVISFEWKVSKD